VHCLRQAGGFSLEVSNTNPGHVMVGVRVLVGSQSIDRAPSYIDIFGRTLPVQYTLFQFGVVCNFNLRLSASV